MFGNPTSAGMGQGAAQVFDTSGVVNTYIRTAMMEQQNRQLEQQEIAKMLGQFDASKLRVKDIPKFNEMYNQLKNLYITNKGLYRNPMQNPQAYSKASELVNGLRTLAAESKAFETFGGAVAQEAIKDRNKLAPDFLDKLKTWNNLGVDEIKAMNGGRLPDYTDVQYIPEEPKFETMKKVVEGIGSSLGAIKTNRTFLTHKEDPTIPEFDQVRIDERVLDHNAAPAMANTILAKEEQYFDYQYRNMSQQEKNALRQDMVSKYPDIANKMTGPQMVATNYVLQNFRVLDRKETVGSNTDAIRADSERRRKENQRFQASENAKSRALSAYLASLRASRSEDEEVENLNLEQSREFLDKVKFLGKGTNSKTTQPLIKQALAPFAQLAPALNKNIQVVHPGDHKTAEEFAQAVLSWTEPKDGKPTKSVAAEVFSIDEERAKEMWRKKVPAIMFETKESKYAYAQVYMIDPSRENIDFAMQPIVNSFGSKTKGFAQGAKGYKTQPTKTVKK